MKRRGKTIALSTAAVALAVLIATAIAAWQRFEEDWWIHVLATTEGKTREHAA